MASDPKGLRGLPLSDNRTVQVDARAVKVQGARRPDREVPDKGGLGVSVMRCFDSLRVFTIRSRLVFGSFKSIKTLPQQFQE
jgi:hypothetical protein